MALLLALGGPAGLAGQSASEIQVTPETMTLAVGQKQPIFAAAYDRQGNLIPSARFTFWSSDTSIARISRDGTVVGVAPGLAKIEARLQGKRASVAVLIGGAGAAGGGAMASSALTLDPVALLLLPGESRRLTPQAVRDDGTPAPIGRVNWKSLKLEVATVDTAGVVTAVAPGKSIVQASTASGLMTTAQVEVEGAALALLGGSDALGPEEAETLHIRVPSQGDRELRDGLQWQSTDTAIAVVSQDGIVAARRPGRTEIVVRGFGQERRAALVVHRPAQTLVLSPKPTAEPMLVPLRASRQFSATAEAADSTPIPEARVTWEVGDTSVVSFDPAAGTMITRATGPTTLTARLRGFEPAIWRIQVVPGNLGVTRARIGLRLGERDSLGAVLLDDAGKLIGPATNVSWSSDHPEVATVAGGAIQGTGLGRAQVMATAPWGKSVVADVYVTADLIVASNRGGTSGLYQIRSSSPESLEPIVVEGASIAQGVLSPDRTRLACSSTLSDGGSDLYLADADGRNPRQLTADSGGEADPVWTPDGGRIVYTATRAGVVPQLASIKSDGTDPRPLTSAPGGSRQPAVSPDGRRIAFVSTRDGNPEIYEMPIDGGAARRLTKTGEKESLPRFLPNGDLLFVVERGGGSRIMRLPVGGAPPAVVFDVDKPVVGLDVSRSGEQVAYVAGKLAQPGKGQSQLTLRLQSLAPGSTAILVPLRPGEQVLSPAY